MTAARLCARVTGSRSSWLLIVNDSLITQHRPAFVRHYAENSKSEQAQGIRIDVRMAGEVRESHKRTDERLNILIDTVDRIIRNRNENEGRRSDN